MFGAKESWKDTIITAFKTLKKDGNFFLAENKNNMPLKLFEFFKFSNAGIQFEIPLTDLNSEKFHGVKLIKADYDKCTKDKLLACLNNR